ncbi:M23 family metallopeptidase [Knoellia sp. 3-2P3]|uniref:M23 family metallopeptidase n=1 Tax=unclassified Knoellia TaxID=2618719 RepID=UPI0023DA7EF0|nr:M23 family metallopeptidase [Knoellia sp. 3-2P3]MDF2093854.1 M23 family metallopeptidase [Knoellia sp. 3-2P3]
MSSRYQGRHRGSSNGRRRIPQSFSSGFALPTAAAATLVLTATGASVAESAPIQLDLTGAEARARADAAALERAEATEERQAFELKMAAAQARVAEEQRASRERARTALLKKQKDAAAKKAAAAAKAKALAAAEAKRKAERKWISPIAGATFTSGFGMRWGRMHNGNDFACPVGTPLMAMSQGTVIFAGQEGGYGNKVEIEYWDGTVSYYAHMDTISVTVGQQVAVGDQVGTSGNTGHSTGPHLHLEIHPGGGGAVDPEPWLRERGVQ